LGCKCEICKLHLNQIKTEGVDPTINDVIALKKRQDKFLAKQVACDQNMKAVYADINQHV